MRNVTFLMCLRVFAFALTVGSVAEPCLAYTRQYGPDPGYVDSVEGEREKDLKDMVVIDPPPKEGPSLHDRIFNDALSKEFVDRYQQQFGRTEAEQQYYDSNKYTYYEDTYGFHGTVIDVNNQRRQFGEYMMRRLAEWHFENYAKSDPTAKKVWDAKEAVSKANVATPNFKINFSYQIASNSADVKAESPWADGRMIAQLPPGQIGPGGLHELTLTVGRNMTRTIRLESNYTVIDGIASIVARKQLSPLLSTSLLASTFTNSTGISTRESLYLAGVSYNF